MKSEPVVILNAALVAVLGFLVAINVIDVDTSTAIAGLVGILLETFLSRSQVSPAA